MQRTTDKFQVALDEISKHARFFSYAQNLRRLGHASFAMDRLGDGERALIRSFIESRLEDSAPTFDALYVSICAHFEEFIRDIHRSILVDLNKKYAPVDKLKMQLLKNHVVATGHLMVRSQSYPRAMKLDINAYALNVGGCSPGNAKYVLNADSFTFFFQGCSPEALEELFEKIGMTLEWDTFGRDAGIKNFFRGGGVREVAKLARNFVSDFVKERNSIAHGGARSQSISEQSVIDATLFFKLFSNVLLGQVASFCATYDK